VHRCTSKYGAVLLIMFIFFGRIIALNEEAKESMSSAPSTVNGESSVTSDGENLISSLIQWFISNKGVMNDKVEIRREFPDDSNSRYGMFAKADISSEELILGIPRTVLLTAEDDEESYGGIWCPTVFNLLREMKLGDKSFYAPYTNYLKSQSQGQLPSHWSDAGQALLHELLAQDDNDKQNDLPPDYVTDWIKGEWHTECEGSHDRNEEHAALLLLQRGWDDIMIPMYDMISHRNGKWLNTKSNSVHNKRQDVKVQASRNIQAGEEIYMSYNFCADCGNKARGYGTAEIFRDYGFVENYPQRWFFGRVGKSKISFELDQDENGKLVVRWLESKPWTKARKYMVKQLDRLIDYGAIVLDSSDQDAVVPEGELNVIRGYQKAMVSALKNALESLDIPTDRDPDCAVDDHSCSLSIRYDDMSWQPDDTNYAVYTCDTEVSMSYDGFDHIEELNSFYQKIDYWKDPKNDNVCFDIESIIQMCGSYRPHYHEMVVHYTARFLPDIRRVLWVGGGDSMLLHEIIKYPNLEFVVGLELDQMITRLSYKQLGTQPHFDNPKVQWWFGDASKSLLMLPEDYFGSFDMVLVDLSETVMSFLVTDGLDIMQALSLLLKPNGILVKNELYLEKMAGIFDYR
jgi:spermidine synthase